MTSSVFEAVTVAQMIEVDRLMIEEFGVSLLQMMENAGHRLATLAHRLLARRGGGRQVTVLVGPGNNGGGGLAAGRHLHNWGVLVQVVLAVPPERLKDAPVHQLQAARRAGIPVLAAANGADAVGDTIAAADLILDALLGYRAQGAPREPMASLIHLANASAAPIVALDLPTGLDPDTGQRSEPAVQAATTVTLALPKVGLLVPAAQQTIGTLYVADIAVPPPVYARLGLASVARPLFGPCGLLKARAATADGTRWVAAAGGC